MQRRVALSGWGRQPVIEAEVIDGLDLTAIRSALRTGSVGIRGLGRSYGDSSLSERVIDMSRFARMRSFDPASGLLCVDAGVTISDLLGVLAPRGWFPPVTPGTRFVTVGGAIASDVHGKNHHHAGAFSDHVLSLELMLGSGDVVTVTPERDPDLFRATCGGMGLTGVIVSATLRMLPVRSNRMTQTSLKLPDLEATLAAIDEHTGWSYSAAWVDCSRRDTGRGRSLLLLGEHGADGDLSPLPGSAVGPAIPFDLPNRALSRRVVAALNGAYHARQRATSATAAVPYTGFFYPLDVMADWNRLYGRRGFLQHQFVTPATAGHRPLLDAMALIAGSGVPAPLAVLKAFGEANGNLLSFPVRGYTLAVDFPASADAFSLLDRLDALALDAGGRVYLTKDARMTSQTFRACYPSWEEFEEIRARWGAHGHFATAQSRRLGLR